MSLFFEHEPFITKKYPDGIYGLSPTDIQEVLSIANNFPRRIWTLIDTDTGTAWINGYHVVNRIAYAVTIRDGKPDESYVELSEEDYDADGELIS